MFNFLKQKKDYNTGFTMVETIIVSVLFLLIVTVVYSIYILNQRIYLKEETTAETSQNARVILERITRELRQAKKIINELPAEKINPPQEIKFQDGHLPEIIEQSNSQGGSLNTIILSSSSSSADDYYKDFFIKIISGAGQGQIRKIYSYQGAGKTAQVDANWDIVPDFSSVYRIDSLFYYIDYYKDATSNILRKVLAYCFSSDGLNCVQPESFAAWNFVPPQGQSVIEITLEQPRIIGEYVNILQFWGSQVINIFLELQKGDRKIDLESKVYGRNL